MSNFKDMRELRIAAALNECQDVIKKYFGSSSDEIAFLVNKVNKLWQNQKMICIKSGIDPSNLPYYKEFEKDAREVEYRNDVMKAGYEFRDQCLNCEEGDTDCLESIILKLPSEPNKGVSNERTRKHSE